MQRIKSASIFKLRYLVIYFFVLVASAIVFYKYTSDPVYTPSNVFPTDYLLFPGPEYIEEGSYLRSKTPEKNECVNFNKSSQKYFCDIGWNYLNFIHRLQKSELSTNKEFIIANSIAEAIALGGAISYTQTEAHVEIVKTRFKTYVPEGFGFYTVYTAHKSGFNYPLDKICRKDMDVPGCWFGVGEASFYSGYKKEELSFSPAAQNGYDFAMVLGGGQTPDESNPFHRLAREFQDDSKPIRKELKTCLERSHFLNCTK